MTEPERITIQGDGISVPDRPIIPFIEGDGTGPDIWNATQPVLDTAVEQAYGSERSIAWTQVLAGEAAHKQTGNWLPDETVESFREHVVGIKGPLTTPVGGGIRSLNVALRQLLDLYACIRPVYHVPGVPSPVKRPQDMDMVIFRENTEDVYAGLEFEPGSDRAEQVRSFFVDEMGTDPDTFRGKNVGIGIKPISEDGSKRLIRKAIQYAIDQDRSSVTLVHKGNIMKFTEGKFVEWGYELAAEQFDAEPLDGGPWHVLENPTTGNEIVIKDVIADNMLQQLLTRTTNYSVIATTNLNGDYISDAAAGQVGGLGMAPGGNIGDGLALFEATHGTAPKYAGQDKVNPGSLILSGVSMLEYLGWREAAEAVLDAMGETIEARVVTYDLARQLEGVDPVPTSVFGEAVCAAIRGEDPTSVVG